MKRTISLPWLREVVRARVCNHCAKLTPGADKLPLDQDRECEHDCHLFQSLPDLRTLAVNMDPVVGNFQRAAVAVCGDAVTTPNGRKVLAVLSEVTGR
jgi:hypothetical protein